MATVPKYSISCATDRYHKAFPCALGVGETRIHSVRLQITICIISNTTCTSWKITCLANTYHEA